MAGSKTRAPLGGHAYKLVAVFGLLLQALLLSAPAHAAYNKPMYGFAMYGEPKLPADFKHFPYVNPNAPKGGVLHMSANGTYDSFNPFTPRGTSARGLSMMVSHDVAPQVPVRIYDSLMLNSLDEPFTMYGLIAKTIEVPPDRSWVKFVLRPQARFHDGSPITVEDVIFTFKLLRDKGMPFYRYYYQNVKSVEKTGPHEVKFTFVSAGQKELPLIIGQMPILSKAYWSTHDITSPTVTPPLSSGPYKIGKYHIGRSVTYDRVKNYWGKDLPVNVGRFNFDQVKVDYYGDAVAAFEGFKAGQVDVWGENKASRWATQYNFPAFKRGDVVRKLFPIKSTQGMQGLYFNTRRPIFSNRIVREAITYAFDFAWTNKNIMYGAYTRSRSYFNNSDLESHGLPTGEELKLLEPFRKIEPPEVFTKEYNPPSTAKHSIYDNLRIAMQLLQKAGWHVGKKGKLVNAQGKPFTFEILLYNPEFKPIVQPFAQNLKLIGITANVRLVDVTQYAELARKFDYDMIVGSEGESDSPGNEQRGQWGSAAANQPGSSNIAGVHDPAVDAIINGLVKANTRAGLVAHVHALDRLLQWGYYCVPMWYLPAVRLAWWKKLDQPSLVPMDGPSLSTWWMEPSADR